MQETREGAEFHSEEKSTDVEEDIRKLMNKKVKHSEKQKDLPIETVETAISLLKQLTVQYDELEAFFKTAKPENTEQFPIELVSEIVKSSKISPVLCKMIENIAEQNKELRKEGDLTKVSEVSIKNQLEQVNTSYRTAKMEAKYLNQALNEATKEIKKQKEEFAQQRKRVLELETALDAQKKLAKELLRDKKVSNKETDIHEEEKQVLQSIIEHKDKEIEKIKAQEEEAVYDRKRIKREHEVLQIQYNRLKKRAELKEKALNNCTTEMEGLIKQMDKLSRSEMQKKERLEYLAINNKKKEYDTQAYATSKSRAGHVRATKAQTEKAKTAEPAARVKDLPAGESASVRRNTPMQPEVIPDETEESEREQSITDIPISFSHAVDDASVSDMEDTVSSNKTATSFKEMQKRTEEMAKKFKELENLLSEIKKSNDSELDKVEERINHRK
ncbi:hypothetical protein NEMIN01_1788 [Nematocida minor]|uniref:uncharacterized protein n=1 Tax=Nematocida minor TaxID=1912983 RepID=UPI00221EC330|nr:uncharacterized protein NEMIN01_1788 [Nematocida minor]KAI5192040.1 hypothetical protein NEMIN01_1788 [Nematocida minor]